MTKCTKTLYQTDAIRTIDSRNSIYVRRSRYLSHNITMKLFRFLHCFMCFCCTLTSVNTMQQHAPQSSTQKSKEVVSATHLYLVFIKTMSFQVLCEFLENSTIHGLYYIATARSKLSKTIWVLIILLSFCLAGYLIHRSFTNWEKSPISTSVQTDSISSAPFPRVTVCPPKAADTALNYDLLLAKNISFTDKDKNWLEDTIDNIFRENKMAMQFFLDIAQNDGLVEIVQASMNIWNTNNSIDKMVIKLITSMYTRWNITNANLPFFFADATSNTTNLKLK